MTGYCDTDKARRDAEWLAGSEADNAERNLARAYLQTRNEMTRYEAAAHPRDSRLNHDNLHLLCDAAEAWDWLARYGYTLSLLYVTDGWACHNASHRFEGATPLAAVQSAMRGGK